MQMLENIHINQSIYEIRAYIVSEYICVGKCKKNDKHTYVTTKTVVFTK